MKLTEWARANNIAPTTAYRWFHNGDLPVEAKQLATGTILIVDPLPKTDSRTVVYARVSGSDQKDDLERQVGRVVAGLTSSGGHVDQIVTEIGSGLNGARPRLKRLLSDKTATVIAVEHRDRLGRFGVEYLEAALSAQNRQIVVINPDEVEDDLVRDMVEILTSFCARLYGRRSSKARAERALRAAGEAHV
jgi:putative resolvase